VKGTYGRVVFVGGVAAALLSLGSLGHAANQTRQASLSLPVPPAGNVTVARFTITGTGAVAPRLTLASRNALPAKAFAVATVRREASGRFVATVAIVHPGEGTAAVPTPQPRKLVVLRLPSGFTLAGPPLIARNVLYANPTPSFVLESGGTAQLLGGDAPKLPLSRIVVDAQLLAFDRSVPLVEMGLFGLEYVAAQIPSASGTTLPVTIGLAGLTQVNAVELRFPKDMKVTKVTTPARTSSIPLGSAVQLVASSGFFQAGVPFAFTLELSRAPKKGEFVVIRASTHYFESSLPFTERFALS
jgi:hypothetical protein